MERYDEYLEFAKSTALYAGEVMLKYFGKQDGNSYKGNRSIVTLADTEINSYVIQQVQKRYPTHAVLGEEESFGKSDYIWLCDPVDGTAQFARGVPVAVFSLALVVDGKPMVGVIYDPFMKNMYYSIKGQGSFKNDERLQVSDTRLGDKEAAVNISTRSLCNFKVIEKMRDEKGAYCMSIGSAARSATLVAEGHYVASIYQQEMGAHDLAAAKLIVEEAGGVLRNVLGEEDRFDGRINGAIVSNKVSFEEILEIVKSNAESA